MGEGGPAPSGEVLLAGTSVEDEWPELINDIADEMVADEAAAADADAAPDDFAREEGFIEPPAELRTARRCQSSRRAGRR